MADIAREEDVEYVHRAEAEDVAQFLLDDRPEGDGGGIGVADMRLDLPAGGHLEFGGPEGAVSDGRDAVAASAAAYRSPRTARLVAVR